MAIESIGSPAATTTSTVQQTSFGQEDLFKILLTQLNYQDPLKPLDNQEFVAKLAQFSDMEQNRQINEKMETLLTMQSANQSIGLLGRTVLFQDSQGIQREGTVGTIEFVGGEPSLSIQASSGAFFTGIRMSQISVVR